MSTYNYVSMNSGTMCQLNVCNCIPAWEIQFEEFYVREDLVGQSIKSILKAPPIYGTRHQPFPELNKVLLDSQPTSLDAVKEIARLTYRFRVAFLEGKVEMTGARLLGQGANNGFELNGRLVLSYNLSPGYYLLWNAGLGQIWTPQNHFQAPKILPPYKLYRNQIGTQNFKQPVYDRYYDLVNTYDDYVNLKDDRIVIVDTHVAVVADYNNLLYRLFDLHKVREITTSSMLPLFEDHIDFCDGLESFDVMEQMDDGSDPTPVPSNDPVPPKHEPDVNVNETPSTNVEQFHEQIGGDQGIDASQTYGPNAARSTSSVMTPEGPVEAVHLAVDTVMDNEIPEFALNYPLPSMANCWHKLEATVTAEGDFVYKPEFNLRTRYFMNMFQYYFSRCVFRIVAKPSLFQSQQFWVGFNPTIKGVASTFSNANNLVGFNWTPSKENEKYVVTPWSSLDFMTSIVDRNQHGQLIISPRSELVSSSGLPTPLEINVYVCPLDMRLYSPKPIDSPDNIIPSPDTPQYFLLQDFPATGSQTINYTINGTEDIVVIPVDVEMPDDGTLDFTITVNSGGLDKEILQTNNGTADGYTVNGGQGAIKGTVSQGASASILYLSSAEFTVNVDSATQSPRSVETLTNVNTRSTDALLSGYNSAFVIPRFLGSVGATRSLNLNGDVIYLQNLSSSVVPGGPWKMYLKAVDVSDDALVEPANGTSYALTIYSQDTVTVTTPASFEVVEQSMFEYKIKHDFKDNEEYYGKTRDHTSRLDNQVGLVGEYQLPSTSTQIVVDFLDPSDGFPYFDKERHLMFSKYPKLHFNVATIPSNNVKVRLTQTNSELPISQESIWQLPGHEWDLSSRTHSISPYWNTPYPAAYSDKVAPLNKQYIQIDVIAGTIEDTPNITVFYDVQDLEYHYQLGPVTFTSSEEPQSFQVEEQSEVTSSPKTTSTVAGGKVEGSPVQSEQRWNYVDSFTVSPDVGIVNIPINSRLFGPWTAKHLSRYARWRGEIKIKIVITNSQLVNANFHAIHSNLYLESGTTIDSSKMLDIIGDIDHSNQGAFGEALVLTLGWRSIKKYAPMDFDSNSADNGFLTIAIPNTSIAPTGTVIPSQLTVYTDCSGITTSLPKSTTYTGGYQRIEPSQYVRM